jgi:hypothetical protein
LRQRGEDFADSEELTVRCFFAGILFPLGRGRVAQFGESRADRPRDP